MQASDSELEHSDRVAALMTDEFADAAIPTGKNAGGRKMRRSNLVEKWRKYEMPPVPGAENCHKRRMRCKIANFLKAFTIVQQPQRKPCDYGIDPGENEVINSVFLHLIAFTSDFSLALASDDI